MECKSDKKHPVIQQRLGSPRIKYSLGPYNKVKGDMQKIRITEGCPHNCPYCYEPQEIKIFGIPKIVRNKVLISDMNLLAKPQAKDIIYELMDTRVNGNPVKYELECGVDYRFLTPEIASLLYHGNFGNFNKAGNWVRNIKIAWDWEYKKQFQKMYDAVERLKLAGFKSKQISIFMICNWKIPFYECLDKLQAISVWNVLVNDCWFDNQTRGDVIPIHWTPLEIKLFGDMCRRNNLLVTFGGYDPECQK
jgi:hypothetical protein